VLLLGLATLSLGLGPFFPKSIDCYPGIDYSMAIAFVPSTARVSAKAELTSYCPACPAKGIAFFFIARINGNDLPKGGR